jgi:DNA-binding GntR family transcriptional regulator
MIVDCELPPGSSVSEPELTQQLELGKAAVRSALLRLSHDRLVTAVPRYGYRVAPLDIKDALELTQLRLLTEPAAFRLATGRIAPAIVELARKRYSAGYEPSNAKSVTRYLTGSREFKLSVAQASGNRRLAVWVGEISESIDRYLRVGATASNMSKAIASNVLPLCDAMLAGDADLAETLATENIVSVTSGIFSSLFGHEPGFPSAFTTESVAALLGLRGPPPARKGAANRKLQRA